MRKDAIVYQFYKIAIHLQPFSLYMNTYLRMCWQENSIQ